MKKTSFLGLLAIFFMGIFAFGYSAPEKTDTDKAEFSIENPSTLFVQSIDAEDGISYEYLPFSDGLNHYAILCKPFLPYLADRSKHPSKEYRRFQEASKNLTVNRHFDSENIGYRNDGLKTTETLISS